MIHQTILRLFAYAVLAALCSQWASAAAPDLSANEELLQRLDSIIAGQQSLVDLKEERISGLRSTFNKLSAPADKLGVARQLYQEYMVYDSDSAMHYANRGLALAEKADPCNQELLNEWLLNITYSYMAQGLFSEARSVLDNVSADLLTQQQRGMYYSIRTNLHMMHALYFKDNSESWKEEMTKSLQYLDSLRTHADEDENYVWAPIVYTINTGKDDFDAADVKRLKDKVDRQQGYSRDNAIAAYWLARYYDKAGDYDRMIRYMTIAAINDAMIVNRDVAAVQTLALNAFDAGQVPRAYDYISYAVNQANQYHARHRMIHISDLSTSIRDAYRQELNKRDTRLRWLAAALGVFALLLAGCVIFIWLELRKLHATRLRLSATNLALQQSVAEHNRTIDNLESVNNRLTEANTRLNEMNAQLHDANEQRLGLLAYAFKLSSKFADDIESYRKKLLKAFKAKDQTTMGVLINDPELIKEQYKAFYEGFDRMTLSLFPDLPSQYNAEVTDDMKVSPESIAKSKQLNTRLRIYALRRLGVSKSADIASMLNVSIRTVYNNRSGNGAAKDE